MSVIIGGIEFDNNFYDEDADVLYLHVDEPSTAVDWDESREGHHLRFGSHGQLVGLTILNARRILEDDGKIVITLPEQRVEANDRADVLAAA
jgi:uncharacterized protein YuzE